MPSHTSLLHRLVFVLLTCASSCHAAIGPKTDLKIVNAALSPDGYSTRDAVLAGGTFPGPLIVGHQGDIFQINVVNQLTNETMLTSTSVHWHGLLQRGTNWADGGAFVNQCPIVSGESFLYEFNAYHPGTFWYHSHLATQYCDGLRGPLVVYDRNDPHAALYDIDDESTVLTLADWYHVAAALETTIPHGDSTLINGMGRWFGNSTAELAVFNVSAGKRYRFRLINMACDPNYTFSIDGHNMTVIEADGENTEPLTVDQLQIFVGQRYSFVLEANQPVDNYWIRAAPNVMTSGGTGFANGINSAILRYSGAPQAEPTTVQSLGVTPLREYDLRPLTDPAAPGQPEVGGGNYSLNLVPGFNSTSHHFTVNNVSYVSPDLPVLLQILAGRDPHKLMPNGSVYNLPLNSVIELSMPALNIGGPHPFHLHGHSFSVVRSAGQTGYNYVNPVRRDVVSIGSGSDNVTIRFVTDNPGPWFLHCHIDWHFQNGLAIVFAEATDLDVAISNPVPPAWWELCPMYNASLQSS